MSSLGHCRRATRAVARRLNAGLKGKGTDLPMTCLIIAVPMWSWIAKGSSPSLPVGKEPIRHPKVHISSPKQTFLWQQDKMLQRQEVGTASRNIRVDLDTAQPLIKLSRNTPLSLIWHLIQGHAKQGGPGCPGLVMCVCIEK